VGFCAATSSAAAKNVFFDTAYVSFYMDPEEIAELIIDIGRRGSYSEATTPGKSRDGRQRSSEAWGCPGGRRSHIL